MIFHRSRLKPTIDVLIRQDEIALANNTTFSNSIDDKLKWINHMSYIKNKILKSSGILRT